MRLLLSLWKFFCYAAGTAVVVFAVYQFHFLAQILYWVDHNPTSTSVMETRLETLHEKNPNAELEHRWVPYSRISDELKRAIITAEDQKFIEHDGFDWEGILRALEKNQRRGRVVAGGSTITQQLAKNLFLSGERSYLRKAQEMVITYMLEYWMDKERIFEIYLNVVEWGTGVFGAEAAAQHYYGVSASQLNAAQ